jgi:AraC family transcriptional regulator
MVSKALGVRPVISADVGRRQPMRVERYLFQARRQRLPALRCAVLVVHLGGARVSGGRLHGRPASFVPSFALFLTPGCPSVWFPEGPIDVAGLYLPDAVGERLAKLVPDSTSAPAQFPFSDALVTAATLQLVEEIARGPGADPRFLEELTRLLVRQTERVLLGRAGSRLSPSRTQLGRVHAALEWIDRNLGDEITNAALARQVGLGESYFRHVFARAFGVSPNQYVQQRRLERARELLTVTQLPIAQIASECGFASQSYLTTCFKSRHGVTPARFRRAVTQHGDSPADLLTPRVARLPRRRGKLYS